MKFLWSRINKRWLFWAIIIGIIINLLQFLPLNLILSIYPEDSPYTRWLGIDPFTIFPKIFYLLLPLIASLPASILLKEDLNSGLLFKIKLQRPIRKVICSYASLAFCMGAIVIAIPLIINFLSWFMIVPNIKPDNLINYNIRVASFNTMFVALYYSHPFVHALIAICFASFWGGLFAMQVTSTSIWIKNQFVAVCSGLILQILIFLLNSVFYLPDFVSYSPIDFLRESAPSNVSLGVTISVTLTMIIFCIVMFLIDEKRLTS